VVGAAGARFAYRVPMRVCVFCGSSSGRARHVEAAREVGRTLAERGVEVVYGGGRVGMMGALAEGALAAGGSVVGVIPRSLVDWEVAHQGLTELHVVETMHERKALMARLADAFVALPGGAGTLEELFEVWTWAQLGLHAKPVGLLDVDGYFEHLIRMVDHMVAEGFLKPPYRDMLLVDHDLDRLLAQCRDYRTPDYAWTEENPLP
jgi:uncharacterized protein (TIGR00730 family)